MNNNNFNKELGYLNLIKELSMIERDAICDQFNDCKKCPHALIFCSKPYCGQCIAYFRLKKMILMGASFKNFEEIKNETKNQSI